jgi:hypothetical protein
MGEALRDEWLRRFREGERVRVYRGYRTRRRAGIALALALVLAVAEVIMIARNAGLVELLILPLVAAISIFWALYEWGIVVHSAVQLSDSQLLVWDWRNRVQRIRYQDLAAVRSSKHFPRETKVRVCHGEKSSTQPLKWTLVLTWPRRVSTSSAVAEELAWRAGLTPRSEGLWTRAYAEELPPTLFWE